MYKALLRLLMLFALFTPLTFARTFPHHSSIESTRHRYGSSSKSTYVRGYTRRDGTYVAPHDRSALGTGAHRRSGSGTVIGKDSFRSGYLSQGYAANSSAERGNNGKIKRSTAAKNAFKNGNPCPANGRTFGSCPGYVIDHIHPLECGGADDPSNIQWQTVAEGKAKDKTGSRSS